MLDRKREAKGAIKPSARQKVAPPKRPPLLSNYHHVRPWSHWERIFRKREISHAVPSHRHRPFLQGSNLPLARAHSQLSLARFGPQKGTLSSWFASHSVRAPGPLTGKEAKLEGLPTGPKSGPSLPNNIPPRASSPLGRSTREEGPRPASRRGRQEKGGKEGRRWGLPWSQVPCRKRHWSPALPPPAPPSSRRPCWHLESVLERWSVGAKGPAAAAAAAAALPHAPRQRRRRHRCRLLSPSAYGQSEAAPHRKWNRNGAQRLTEAKRSGRSACKQWNRVTWSVPPLPPQGSAPHPRPLSARALERAPAYSV